MTIAISISITISIAITISISITISVLLLVLHSQLLVSSNYFNLNSENILEPIKITIIMIKLIVIIALSLS